MLGDTATGKSCVLLRYTDGSFSDDAKLTIGVDNKIQNVEVEGTRVKMYIWDTAGLI